MKKTIEKTRKVVRNNQNGITLIALVITIIVLLILAGVAISMLAGDNGILGQASRAKDNTDSAKKLEEAKIELTNYLIEFETNKSKINKDNMNIKDYIPSYDENKYRLGLRYHEAFGYCVVSIPDNLFLNDTEKIMTREKMDACESVGFYLLGDINKDGVVNELDNDKCNEIISLHGNIKECEKRGFFKREIITANLNGDDRINATDRTIFNMYISRQLNKKQNEIMGYILDDYEKYLNMLEESGKKEDGTYKEINAITEEEIQKYIPSYKDNLNLAYKLVIQRGEVYWIYDKSNGYVPQYIRNNFSILGDINNDDKINEIDITRMESIINNSTYKEIADMNNDGVIDNKDLEILKSMI